MADRPIRSGVPVPGIVLFYATFYAGAGVLLPFWPLFLEYQGFSVEQVGLPAGLFFVVKIHAGPVFRYPPRPRCRPSARH